MMEKKKLQKCQLNLKSKVGGGVGSNPLKPNSKKKKFTTKGKFWQRNRHYLVIQPHSPTFVNLKQAYLVFKPADSMS